MDGFYLRMITDPILMQEKKSNYLCSVAKNIHFNKAKSQMVSLITLYQFQKMLSFIKKWNVQFEALAEISHI